MILTFLLVLGIIVRTTNYLLADLSLWNDEAALALNIIHRSFFSFFRPLDYNQVAPIGFCLLGKAAVAIFGNNEFAFRLFPFLSSIAAIGLAFLLIRNSIGLIPAFLCAAQLAVIKEARFYATDFKPYASDLAIAIGLMLLAWKGNSAQWSWKRYILFAVAGSVAIWFSFPAIFILGGIGALWLMDWMRKPDKKIFVALVFSCALWLSSFWCQFQLIQSQAKNAFLLSSWSNAFMPLTIESLNDLKFFFHLPHIFRDPLWTFYPPISVVMFIGGCLIMFRTHRRMLALVLFPLFLNLIVSGLHIYPFGDRLLQYATLNLFIPIAVFLSCFLLKSMNIRWLKIVILILIIGNLAEPSINAAKNIFIPRKREQMKQVVMQLCVNPYGKTHYYVFGSSYISFDYYMERYHLFPQSVTVGPGVEERNSAKIGNRMSALQGKTWLIFGHGKQFKGFDFESLYIENADYKGVLMEKIKDVGAAAYLYDFLKSHAAGRQANTTQ